MRDHPRASVVEVSEETGVEEEKILQYLRDGRLISSGFTEVITCERCGKSIRAGRYCEACKAILDIQLKSAIPQAQRPEPPENKPPRLGRNSDGMHIKKE
ncbi:hypothetical protein [Syntrophomonas palmitatica]|uniref:hypothetical protein n=1 Tax=Syntrophomonas palmitatica TaxID=402877 RepID=UPI0006D0A3FD|nr:hypothetical protein [Syntrophomonas palmitatica]